MLSLLASFTAKFLALVCVMFYCVLSLPGQVWYLIVSIPDLCLLTYIYIRKMLTNRETGLSQPVKYFTDRSKAVLLLFFLPCVCFAFVRVCLYVPCGHLLGKGWPLGSRLL